MATLYCGPTSAGSNTGADFTNRIALPNTTGFTRGNVYVCIGSGSSYGSKTLSTATSGTSTITIRKANAAQDSGIAGWSSTFESTQATFGDITVSTRYWIFDGITRTETAFAAQPSGYGFRATSLGADSGSGDDADNFTCRFVDIGSAWATNPSAGTIAGYGAGVRFVYNQTDVTFDRCAIHNGINLAMVHGSVRMSFLAVDFYYGWGKEAIAAPNVGLNDLIVANCRFFNSTQKDPNDPTSGLTAEIGVFGDGIPIDGVEIYGCQFACNLSSTGRNAVIALGGLGFNSSATNCLAYNNTIAGIEDSGVYGSIVLSGGSGNQAKNNLHYDCANTSITANTTATNINASLDPFVDYAGLDWNITNTGQAFETGTDLGAGPWDTDPNGNSRDNDTPWSAGAFAYDGGAPPETGNIVCAAFVTGTLTVG